VIVHCAQLFFLLTSIVFEANEFSLHSFQSQCKDAISNFSRGITSQEGTCRQAAMAWTRTERREVQPELARRYADNKAVTAHLTNPLQNGLPCALPLVYQLLKVFSHIVL
jgi:hypothetical protein